MFVCVVCHLYVKKWWNCGWRWDNKKQFNFILTWFLLYIRTSYLKLILKQRPWDLKFRILIRLILTHFTFKRLSNTFKKTNLYHITNIYVLPKTKLTKKQRIGLISCNSGRQNFSENPNIFKRKELREFQQLN